MYHDDDFSGSFDKVDFLLELIHCAFPLRHWVYSMEGEVLKSEGREDERILDIIFSASGAKNYMLEYAATHTMPLVLNSPLGNYWIAVPEPFGDTKRCHMLGPAFTEMLSPEKLQERISGYRITVRWKNTFIDLIQNFCVIPWSTLALYTVMLHYTLTGEQIQNSDLSYQTVSESSSYSVLQDTEQGQKKNLPWKAEQALFECIRSGNLNYHTVLAKASTVSSGLGIHIGDSLQQARYSSVVFTALSTRAAIEGGLSPEIAYTIQNHYTQLLESAQFVSDIANNNHQMYDEFVRRIHSLKQKPNLAPQIRDCCDYIELHCAEKINLPDIAKSIGYSVYYLSRRFHKEVGVSVTAYINQEKIKQAKILLSTTKMSILEISEALSFCSRSHFADTFHKLTGQTPGEYRKECRKHEAG